jgi:hypothetical protein
MTQCEAILKYIDDFGSITSLEAMTKLGILRPSARIAELRKNNIQIKDRWLEVKSRYVKKDQVKQYYIDN